MSLLLFGGKESPGDGIECMRRRHGEQMPGVRNHGQVGFWDGCRDPSGIRKAGAIPLPAQHKRGRSDLWKYSGEVARFQSVQYVDPPGAIGKVGNRAHEPAGAMPFDPKPPQRRPSWRDLRSTGQDQPANQLRALGCNPRHDDRSKRVAAQVNRP